MSVRNIVKSIQDIMRQDVGVDGDAQRISQLCWMFFLKIIDDQDQQLELLKDGYRSPIPRRFQWRAWAANPEGITGDELLAFVNDELFPALKELPTGGKQGDRRRVVRDVFEDAYNYMKSGQLMRQVVNKINGVDFNNLSEKQHFGDIYEQILNDLQSAGNAGEYYTPRAVTAFMADRIDPRPGELLLDPACGTGGFLTCSLRHMRERYVKKVADEERMQAALRAVEKKQLPHMLCVTNMLLHGIEDPSFVRHDNTLARPYISYTASDRVDIVLTNPPFGGREEDGIEANFPKQFQTRETADLFLALIIRLLKPNGRAGVVLPDGTLFGEGVKTRLKEHLMEECNLHTIVRLPNSVFKPYASIGTNLLFFEKGSPTKEIWFYEHRVPDGQKAYSMTKPIKVEHLQPCVDWWGGAKRKGRQETEVAWKVTADEVKARGYIQKPARHRRRPRRPRGTAKEARRGGAAGRGASRQAQGDFGRGAAAMRAEQLLAHFDRISDAPNAVQRLRSFILELAVRGKLVSQSSNDAPAADFLKNRRLALELGDEPWDLPCGWAWSSLSLLGQTVGGGTPSKLNVDFWQGSIPWVTPKDMKVDFISDSRDHISEEAIEKSSAKLIPTGSLLMVVRGMILAHSFPTAISTAVVTINQDMKALVPFRSDLIAMLLLLTKGLKRQVLKLVHRSTHGTGKLLTGELFSLPLPIPPLAEQRRIVAKVDELMALCDQLEAAQAERESRRDRLAAASLARLNNGADPGAFREHARFHLRHLSRLATRPDHIKQLRQTILNLAVRGRLVPHDPNDEPAKELLGKRQVVLVSPELWKLPAGWAWSSFGLVGETLGGGTPTKTTPEFWNGNIPWVSPKDMKVDRIGDSQDHISVEAIANSSAKLIPTGSLLLVVRGMILAHSFPTAISTAPLTINQDMKAIVPFRPELAAMLLLLTRGMKPHVLLLVQRSTHGTCKLLTGDLFSLPIPIPPLAEQRRIVARVDELMALCDQLDEALAARQTESRRLLEALLHEALAPPR